MTSKSQRWRHVHLDITLWVHVGPLWEPKSDPDLIFHDLGRQINDFWNTKRWFDILQRYLSKEFAFLWLALLIMLYLGLLRVNLFILFMLLTWFDLSTYSHPHFAYIAYFAYLTYLSSLWLIPSVFRYWTCLGVTLFNLLTYLRV